jgi:acetamidase/formamidase
MLASVAVDMEITQLVDGNVGVHAMLPKKVFTGERR